MSQTLAQTFGIDTGKANDRLFNPSSVSLKDSMSQSFPSECAPDSLLAFRRLVYDNSDPFTGKTLSPWGFRDKLTQAMSSTDFASALSTDLTYQMMEIYSLIGPQLAQIAVKGTLPDFNAYTAMTIGGGNKPMAEMTPEGGRTADKLADRTLGTRQLRPYSKVMSLRWDAILSDFRNVFARIPQTLARSAANTVEVVMAKKLFVATTGWNITTGQGSAATTAFTLTNLETAWKAFTAYTDPVESLPLNVQPVYLIHSPGITIDVNNVLNSIELRDPSNTGRYGTYNEIARRGLTPIEAHWPGYVIGGSTVKNTWWGLFAAPAAIPVLEYQFLESEEGPQIFYRMPDMMRAGGGPVQRSFAGSTIDIAGEVCCGANLILEGGTTTYGCWVSQGQ